MTVDLKPLKFKLRRAVFVDAKSVHVENGAIVVVSNSGVDHHFKLGEWSVEVTEPLCDFVL